MKQISFSYTDESKFSEQLNQLKKELPEMNAQELFFQVYAEASEKECVKEIQQLLHETFPGVSYAGCSANGCIRDGMISQGSCNILATAFEEPTTKNKVFQYSYDKSNLGEIGEEIVQEIKKNPWVKAVELLITLPDDSLLPLCDALSEVYPEIHMFGGIACNNDITSENSFVFSSCGECSEQGIVAIFFGGEEFHVTSIFVTGWKPLGKRFHITRAEGVHLYELDGKPAYNAYRDYLNIGNDEHFFNNTLEFPLFYEHNGINILRAPLESLPDGSIRLSAEIEEGSYGRIAYGNPMTILEIVERESRKIMDFHPELLHIFSCAARRSFWDNDESAMNELKSLRSIAPSFGFFTLGELLRSRGTLNQHNVTMVVGAFREGDPKEKDNWTNEVYQELGTDEKGSIEHRRIPVVIRLANYISVAAQELEEANQKLEEMNQELEILNRQLEVMAIYDGLTKLYNRVEIQRRIANCLAKVSSTPFSLIMFDIDDFKYVNDNYGHKNGDYVIITMANILRRVAQHSDRVAFAGRWGGEEFMLLLPGCELKEAYEIAEDIRKQFEAVEYVSMPGQTTSVGVTQAMEDEDIDTLFTRVDAGLYKAKNAGKNKVVMV